MKVIVTSWIFPNENGLNSDERPKSIENIASTIESLKDFVENYEMKGFCADVIDFAHSTLPFFEERFLEDDEIQKFWRGDGFTYLESCLKNNNLGRCIARMYNSKQKEKRQVANREVSYHYLLFQVRNLH